jgi:2-polyprenyl-3-methyl-5-hydroxy-6-metoxy-1,4-benzoquinol methylase
MNDELRIQTDFWNREADAFERIYSHKKSAVANWLDRYFRSDMYERFLFTIQRSEPILSKKILDVGCGNGLYAIEFARRGASRVLGIDIAAKMLDRARAQAREANVDAHCTFEQSDLLQLRTEERFDVTIGIGLFDYISDPRPVIAAMRKVTSGIVIASFPRLWTWRMPIRKLRLSLRGCPVFFYTAQDVRGLFLSQGYRTCALTRVGKLHCVVAEV